MLLDLKQIAQISGFSKRQLEHRLTKLSPKKATVQVLDRKFLLTKDGVKWWCRSADLEWLTLPTVVAPVGRGVGRKPTTKRT